MLEERLGSFASSLKQKIEDAAVTRGKKPRTNIIYGYDKEGQRARRLEEKDPKRQAEIYWSIYDYETSLLKKESQPMIQRAKIACSYCIRQHPEQAGEVPDWYWKEDASCKERVLELLSVRFGNQESFLQEAQTVLSKEEADLDFLDRTMLFYAKEMGIPIKEKEEIPEKVEEEVEKEKKSLLFDGYFEEEKEKEEEHTLSKEDFSQLSKAILENPQMIASLDAEVLEIKRADDDVLYNPLLEAMMPYADEIAQNARFILASKESPLSKVDEGMLELNESLEDYLKELQRHEDGLEQRREEWMQEAFSWDKEEIHQKELASYRTYQSKEEGLPTCPVDESHLEKDALLTEEIPSKEQREEDEKEISFLLSLEANKNREEAYEKREEKERDERSDLKEEWASYEDRAFAREIDEFSNEEFLDSGWDMESSGQGDRAYDFDEMER